VYRIRISKDGKITQEPERITFGTGLETKPALSAGGQLALASETFASHLWSLPADTNRGKATGSMTPVTTEATVDTWPRISTDGKKIIYYSSYRDTRKLFLRNLENGTQKQLVPSWNFSPGSYWAPLIASGTKVLFTARSSTEAGSGRGPRGPIYALDLNGGVPVLLREKSSLLCASEDGRHFLANTRGGTAVDTQTHQEFQFTFTEGNLLSPQFSWDGRWVALHERNNETTRQIYVLPFHEGRPTPRSEWIPVTNGKQLDRDPQWSPDGNLLYFLADRDGARGIYAQRLEPVTKHSSGAPFEVKMFRSARRSMMLFANSGDSSPAVAQDKLVFPLGEMTGNIWLTKMP
jgi:Tol biopolymer transport system component